MSIGHTKLSIRPLDEQKCPLDIHMSIRPMDEQKCPFDIQMSIRPLGKQKCPVNIQMSIRPMDEQKCPVDIQMSIGHLAEVLDMFTVIEIAIFFNKLQYVLKPKTTHRGRIKLASHIWVYFDIGYSKNEVNI